MRQTYSRRARNHVAAACLVGAILAGPIGRLTASGRQVVLPQDLGSTSSTFGPFLAAARRYTVTMNYATLSSALSDRANQPLVRTLARVTVADATGRSVYARDVSYRVTPSGFEPEQEGTAYEVVGESGTAIVIEAAEVRSGQPHVKPLGWMIALVKEGGGLRLAEPEIRFRGNLEHFPGPPLGPGRLVSGDFMRVKEWTGHYFLIGAFSADFKAAVISATCVRDCTLPIVAHGQAILGGEAISLYSRPLGSAEKVVLQANSRIEYLDTYVADFAHYDPLSDEGAKRPWLHVRIDNREGWVAHAGDLAALGLPYSP